ncbi:unnamed protein product [Psylliodes chrysocephalus]|uniref:Vesicle transport protein n=1 Tax=Psylliodes chrysocephalus TaxID=3402493 RepID=A0A9P0D0G5_9CUCU|nr:unnamed protein product [Psylliodes chrysocephala]
MVDLKKDLDEYLLLQSDQKKSFKLQIPTIQTPNVSGWFRKEQTQQEDTWFQETKKEYCPSLSRLQRMVLFAVCVGLGLLCFSISLMYIPVLLFKARKFALLFTLGSTFFILSFFFLWGPLAFLKHMFAKERLLVTITYGGTLVATLYCALHLQSTPFTVLFAVCQIISLVWTVLANIPGGTAGISIMSKMFSRSSGNTLPI